MDYSIVSDYIEDKVDIPITKGQYERISNGIRCVVRATDAEELYLVCVYNYEDYERHLQHVALDHMLYRKEEYSEFWAISTRTHQRLANFLSSCRAYLDQIPSIAGTFADEAPGIRDKIKALTHEWYDGSLSYRLMEALRNFVQHSGFGVHGHTLGSKWTSKGDRIKHRAHHWMDPYITPSRLAEDSKVKRSLVSEISNLKTINISPHVREYMRAIGEVQSLFRAETAEAVRKAEQPITWALHKHRKKSERGDAIGAVAVELDNGIRVRECAVLQQTLDYHAELKRKVGNLTNLELRIISTADPS